MTACRFPDIDKLKALRCARSVEWDDPYGGVCRDEFVLGEGGHSLTQVSDMTIRGSGRRCQYRRRRNPAFARLLRRGAAQAAAARCRRLHEPVHARLCAVSHRVLGDPSLPDH